MASTFMVFATCGLLSPYVGEDVTIRAIGSCTLASVVAHRSNEREAI